MSKSCDSHHKIRISEWLLQSGIAYELNQYPFNTGIHSSPNSPQILLLWIVAGWGEQKWSINPSIMTFFPNSPYNLNMAERIGLMHEQLQTWVSCVEPFLYACVHISFFLILYIPDTRPFLFSTAGWVAPFFFYSTTLAVGIVSLWSGIIFHSCYQMDTRWVIVASTSGLSKSTQKPVGTDLSMSRSEWIFKEMLLKTASTHLLLTLMTLRKKGQRKKILVDKPLTRHYISKNRPG